MLYLAGVARGDVHRVDLVAPGLEQRTLYTRDVTWGQFSTATELPRGGARLELYGRRRHVGTVPLDVPAGASARALLALSLATKSAHRPKAGRVRINRIVPPAEAPTERRDDSWRFDRDLRRQRPLLERQEKTG
ncbi:MAG TPA: hypothetical protein VGJ77_11125 [Gaiellaceae bacterium]